ncbi:MAG: hypothetical protein IPP05_09860 [Cytophagaceae bacterium]|nr:hypothetical protein [Cytophagaceae bacterium]
MKRIFITLVVLLSTYYGFTQTVNFIQPPTQINPGMCYGGNQTITATTQNASGFVVQVLNSQNSWEDFPGSGGELNSSPGAISYTFYGINYAFAFRVRIYNSTDTLDSGPQTISPQRPDFSFHPANLAQCTGNSVKFYAGATGNGTLTYQWYRIDGSSYTALINGGEFSGVTTNGLSINSVGAVHHEKEFIVKVTDQNGCENYSNSGKLTANQLSTVVSPTTTRQYCEGDTVSFSVATKIGEVSSQNWMKKFGSESVYTNITPSSHFSDPTGDILRVFGIKPTETSYRFRVNFVVKTQNPDGSVTESTCFKDATRANYVINPRPGKPSAIPDLERCGPGKVNYSVTVPGSYFWYKDTTIYPIISNQLVFNSPEIADSREFYVSQKDLKGCESHKTILNAVVRKIPENYFQNLFELCPDSENFDLIFDSTKYNPEKIYIKNGSSPIPDFTEIIGEIFTNPFNISMPANIPPGNYNLQFFTKNPYCFSDTSILNIEIKTPISISTSETNANLCEGESHTFTVNYEGDGPYFYQWYKNEIPINGETNQDLKIEDLRETHEGNYAVNVEGFCGNETKFLGSVEVLPPTHIVTQPSPVRVCENGNASFSVEATGSGILHYQWFINNNPVGTDSSGLKIPIADISQNQAEIKCKITSDCGNGIFTDTVLLTVIPLPVTPMIDEIVGFCQNENPATLTAGALPNHTLRWFDTHQNILTSPQIVINQSGTRTFYVNQTDTNQCQSPLKAFEVEVSPSFGLEVFSDKNFICPAGNFNNKINIESRIEPESITAEIFKFYQNGIFNSENLAGSFEGNTSGIFKIIAKKGFCEIADSIQINSIFSELNTSPLASDVSVCQNNSVDLMANSEYQNGEYYWWESQNSPISNHQGSSLTTESISTNQKYYVSYVKSNSESQTCESPRKEISVDLKQNIRATIVVSNISCLGRNDGKIEINAESIALPLRYELNDTITNNLGIFENLSPGIYNLKITDKEGCNVDTTLIIEINSGPEFSTQPANITRCKGNTATISFSGNNYNSIIWEKKLPGESSFSIISGANSSVLNLSNIGNSTNPHGTVFRVKISNGICEMVSNEAILSVNSVSPTNSTNSFCENSNNVIDLQNISIVGNISTFQWENRSGTTGPWNSINNANDSILVFQNIQRNHAGYYRAKITFDNGNGNSCVINTTTSTGFRIIVDTLQIPVLSDDLYICSGNSAMLSVSNCTGNILWSNGQTLSSILVSPNHSTKYAVSCTNNSCVAYSSDSLLVTVLENAETAPIIYSEKLNYCLGDTISISATGCEGQVVWNNNMTGNNLRLPANSSFNISAHCISQDCSSPESQTVNITVLPQIIAGTIQDYTQTNCAGFNPATINSLVNPSGGTIQWQMAENCSASEPSWVNISGANGLTFNPSALNTTTCFRRMVFDSCQTVFSNVVTFHIVPDPVVSVSADLNEVCFGNSVLLTKTVIGGQVTCPVQWQINKISGSVSSTFWQNYALSDSLEIPNLNVGNDSIWYFRARVDCENSSCNLAVSEAVPVVFHPELILETNFSDSTICAGSSILLTASACNASLKWSTGETSSSITISPVSSGPVKVSCKNTCDSVSKTFNINVVPGISAPNITVNKTRFCFGDTISISANGCEGQVVWSNNMTGNNLRLSAESSFSISAHCASQDCSSPESQTVNITVLPQIIAGTIQDYTQSNCAGFNPATINSLTDRSGGTIQWQMAENCSVSEPNWENISGANSLTFNPSALNTTTCFRRMVFDSCQTVFSNVVTYNIVPDPVVSVSTDLAEVCFGNSVLLSKTIIGGQGNCPVQWQINKVSGSASSTFWQNYALEDSLEIPNQNLGNDSTWYFRARVDCENSSCNLAVSEAVLVVFHPKLSLETNFSDSTICAGSSIILTANGCKASLKWSTGETSSTVMLSPENSKIITVSCKNSCDSISKTFNINVVPGISAPNITVNKTRFCFGDTISISATGCEGQVVWNNNMTGNNLRLPANSSFNISAHCISQDCSSPESQTVNITVLPQIIAGTIQDYTQTNCAGFNPATINSLVNPSGGTIQWQMAENCSASEPSWVNISGANGLTFNPSALNTTTCFRRMVFDSCQTVFSNVVTFHIVPDPVVSVSADLAEVCFGNSVLLTKIIIGGQGTCPVQWQINKVSGSVSSAFGKIMLWEIPLKSQIIIWVPIPAGISGQESIVKILPAIWRFQKLFRLFFIQN